MLCTAWHILSLQICGITAVHFCVWCVLTMTFGLWPLELSEVRSSLCHVGATPVYPSTARLCVCVCLCVREREIIFPMSQERDRWIHAVGVSNGYNNTTKYLEPEMRTHSHTHSSIAAGSFARVSTTHTLLREKVTDVNLVGIDLFIQMEAFIHKNETQYTSLLHHLLNGQCAHNTHTYMPAYYLCGEGWH